MRKEMKDILGSEYSVAIEKEINTLKPEDRLLCGDVLAVVKRSDSNMGRPIEDCNESNNITYVIMGPSKIGIITQKNIGAVRCESGKFVIMSINYFVEQLLEFNFTHLQILYCGEVLYATDDYWKIGSRISGTVHLRKNDTINKLVSMCHGVSSDIHKKGYKDKQLEDRMFLMFKALCTLDNLIKNHEWKLDKTLDINKYTSVVKGADIEYLDKWLGEADEYVAKHIVKREKWELKVDKLNDITSILMELTHYTFRYI